MNQPPGDPYGGIGRPGGTIPGGPPIDINAPPPQEPGRAPVAPTMVDQPVPAAPAMTPPPMMQPGMPYAPPQPMGHPGMAPMGQPGMAPMGQPGMAPMPGAPLGAPYGVAPPVYQRRQKSSLPLVLGLVLGGMAMVAIVGGIAVFARRGSSDADIDAGPIEIPTATETVAAPTDTPPAETTPPPVDTTTPTATATSTYTPPKSTATSTAKTPATATATSTAKPPATATATSTAKPPATATATATNTSKTPPGGRPPPIRIKR